MWIPQTAPEAIASLARRAGPPKKETAQAYQAAVASAHWNNLRVGRRGTWRTRKARVDHAQDHLRKIRLSGLRFDAKVWVFAKGCGWVVRRGFEVSRKVLCLREKYVPWITARDARMSAMRRRSRFAIECVRLGARDINPRDWVSSLNPTMAWLASSLSYVYVDPPNSNLLCCICRSVSLA